jgi:hypothetical protein
MDPTCLRKNRDAVLRYVYEHGAGSFNFDVPIDQICAALRLSTNELSKVAVVLNNQGLLAQGQVNCIGLNHSGQYEAERLGPAVLMRDPTPISTVQNIHIGTATNSTVQIAGGQSHQHSKQSITHLHNVLDEIERRLETADIDPASRSDAADLIAALRGSVTGAVAKAAASALGAIINPISADLANRLLSWFAGG